MVIRKYEVFPLKNIEFTLRPTLYWRIIGYKEVVRISISTPDEIRTHIVGTGIRYSIH